jgi:hypothetical protein
MDSCLANGYAVELPGMGNEGKRHGLWTTNEFMKYGLKSLPTKLVGEERCKV